MKVKSILTLRFFVFLTIFLVFLTFASLNREGTNPGVRFSFTKSIAYYHQLNISTQDLDFYGNTDYAVYNGNFYLDKPPGLPLLSIPFYMLGNGLYKLGITLPQTDTFNYTGDANAFFVIVIFILFVNSLGALKLFDLLRLLKFSTVGSLLVSYIFAFGTLFWVYASSLFAHSFSASLLIFTLYFLIKSKRNLIAAGLIFGFAITVEYTMLLLLPIFLIYFALQRKNFVKNCIHFFLPIILFLLMLMVYNWISFGGPFNISYLSGNWKENQVFDNPLISGVYDLTFSTWRGLFFFNPILILSITGAMLFFRKFKNEAILLMSISALYIALFGTYRYFWGGVTYGPRYLISIIPALAILATPMLERDFYKKPLQKFKIPEKIYVIIIAALLAVSIFHTFLGVFVNSYPYPEIDKNPIYNIIIPQLFSGVRNGFLFVKYQSLFYIMLIVDMCLVVTSFLYAKSSGPKEN